MQRETVRDLIVFLSVARERSFTRAAAKLGVTQSALSHTIRLLEARLGLRLLTRTTRSVSPTEAGQRLLEAIGPRLEAIEADLEQLQNARDRPSGTLRITATDFAIRSHLWPRLQPYLNAYPEVTLELHNDYGRADIVADRFDAGVRLGEHVAKDMISVRISEDLRFAIVATPEVFDRYGRPSAPQDLTGLPCITLRLPTHGGVYVWEFERDGQELRVRVDGPLIFNNVYDVAAAAVDGFGIAHIPEALAAPYLADGRLVRVLDDWCPAWTGYHLYYPSRRQPTAAFSLLVEALRQPLRAD